MKIQGLIDSGALIALLDDTDRWHRRCQAEMAQKQFPLATSIAVVTEVLYHFGRRADHVKAVWALLRQPLFKILPISKPDFPAIESLMLRYSDRPMDFADATLVRLAERENLTDVFTIDSDFDIYRIGGTRPFKRFPKL